MRAASGDIEYIASRYSDIFDLLRRAQPKARHRYYRRQATTRLAGLRQ